MGDPIDFRRRLAMPAADIRSRVWLVLALGLLAVQTMRLWPENAAVEAPAALAPPPSPWVEPERLRAIPQPQEEPAVAIVPAAPSSTVQFTGIRVIDGDTFDYGGERIRIVGIDTPETHPARCSYEAELGERATRRLIALLAAGPFDLVPIDRDEDRYGHKLRIVMRGGRDLGQILVAEGLARSSDGGRRSGWCG